MSEKMEPNIIFPGHPVTNDLGAGAGGESNSPWYSKPAHRPVNETDLRPLGFLVLMEVPHRITLLLTGPAL